MVYSPADALKLAQAHPEREVGFFAIGFETTTPPTAVAIRAAEAEGLANFSVFCNHVLTPAAIAREVQPGRRYNLMEFCGGHTHAISRYGILGLLGVEPGQRVADVHDHVIARAHAVDERK